MHQALKSCWIACALIVAAGGVNAADDDRPPPLPIEPTFVIETLPAQYPDQWLLVHEASFFNMSDGKIIIMDASADTLPEQYKGSFNNALMGNYLQNSARSEIYATETFHTRGNRGERIDVLTIWDMATLSPKGEVILPGKKRFMGMPERFAMTLTNGGKWLVIANLSPATSATIIDLDSRSIVTEVPTPGCTFTYPLGSMGFASLCADGRFMSTVLNADGSIKQQVRTDAFFDTDASPIYERPTVIGNTAWFPSIAGLMYPVDISGELISVGEPWSLVPESERAENWAPGGIALIDHDDAGRIFVIMHPDAKDGSYQGGGPEVWVFDPERQSRVARIALKEWGLSLALTHGTDPMLVVLNPVDMSLEVYDPDTGQFIRKITDFGQYTPLRFSGSE